MKKRNSAKKRLYRNIYKIRRMRNYNEFIDNTFCNLQTPGTISLGALIDYIKSLFSDIYRRGKIPNFILFLPFILKNIILISLLMKQHL